MRYALPGKDIFDWARRLVVQLERDINEALYRTLPYAEMHVSTAAATTISGTADYVKAAGTTTLDDASFHFTMPANNRLLYSGIRTEEFLINFTVTATAASNNQVVAVALAVNGTVSGYILARFLKVAAADLDAAGVTGLVQLAPGDYVEVFVRNETSASNITLQNMNLTIVGLNR